MLPASGLSPVAGCAFRTSESIRTFAPAHSPRLIRFVWVRSMVWRVSRRSASHCARVLQTRVRFNIEPVSRWLRQIIWLGSAVPAPLAGELVEGSADAAADTSNAQTNKDFFMNLTHAQGKVDDQNGVREAGKSSWRMSQIVT